MRSKHEHAGGDRYTVKGFFKESFIEANQLGYEGHIRVGNRATLLDVFQAFVESHLLFVNEICQADSGTARNTLNAVHVNLSVLIARLLYELDGIVENTLNLLSHVVFQVVLFVLESAVMIVCAIISRTVDHMRDALLFQQLLIMCNKISTQVQEIIDYF